MVEDSRVAQSILRAALELESDIDVVGTALDAHEARACIKALDPDVLTLDVAMPGMNGITFLRNLMRLRPIPVVMVSVYADEGGEVHQQALELGAQAVVRKPSALAGGEMLEMAARLRACVRKAASVDRRKLQEVSVRVREMPFDVRRVLPLVEGAVVAMGASTGGVEALEDIIRRLPVVFPPVVVVQHMSEEFVSSFARRLSLRSQRPVHVTADGMRLMHGHVYVASGAVQLEVKRAGTDLCLSMRGCERVSGHCPSVDVLFASVARAAGPLGVGVLLTGMGSDGVAGLGQIQAAGGVTVVQDEASSVVWGMPGEAVRRGLADHVEPLSAIASKLLSVVQELARST